MNKEALANMIELMKERLHGKHVRKIYNSIGSNLFLKIGYYIELPGSKERREEWVFWMNFNAWRITKNNAYIVGSGDDRDDIKIGIEQLLNRSVKGFHFTSDFLDLQIDFDGGYQLNSFLHCFEEDQWTIFMPNSEDLSLEVQSWGNLKIIQKIGKEFAVSQGYKPIETHLENPIIKTFDINEHNELRIVLGNDDILYLIYPIWRMELNHEFVLGCFHDEQTNAEEILSKLIGKEIRQISVANGFMDAQFLIGDDIVLRTFACIRSDHQWEIYNKDDEVLFGVDIELRDLDEIGALDVNNTSKHSSRDLNDIQCVISTGKTFMRYFTKDWCYSVLNDKQIEEIKLEYERYINAIYPTLPFVLKLFTKTIHFHDGVIKKVLFSQDLKFLILEGLFGDLQAGYFVLEIKYIRVSPLDIDLLYSTFDEQKVEVLSDEIECISDNRYAHRFLFSTNNEFEIVFEDIKMSITSIDAKHYARNVCKLRLL